ncbi:hypothetical protein LguiA_031600 [Lonicera macranthoides]
MASSLPSVCSLSKQPLIRRKLGKHHQVRYQIFRYEGNSGNNIVDANLSVLRRRIEELRKKERLENCCKVTSGWNYNSAGGYQKKRAILVESIEVLGSMSSAIGLVLLSGSLSIFFVSFLAHMCT